MGQGFVNLFSLVVLVGIACIGATLGVDLKTRRGYGILALALLVAVTLAYSWANAIDVISAEERATRGIGGLLAGLVILLYWLATLFAVGFVSIAGLIEMAIARRWWWFWGLSAALALMVMQTFLRDIFNLSHIFPFPDAALSFPVSQIAYEIIPLIVCFAYGLWRTWPRAQVAATS